MKILVLLAVFALLWANVKAGELAVIESNVEALPAGKIVNTSDVLSLDGGAVVKLIAETGEIIDLEGPYSGLPASNVVPGKSALIGQIAALFGDDADESAVGATRSLGPDTGSEPPDPWWLDLNTEGAQCVAPQGTVTLWRARTSPGERLTLWRTRDGIESGKTLTWTIGDATLSWPSDVVIADSEVFQIYTVTNDRTRRWTMHRIPASVSTGIERAAWMSEKGCKRQARALVLSLE